MQEAARVVADALIELAVYINAGADRRAAVGSKRIEIGKRLGIMALGDCAQSSQHAIQRLVLARVVNVERAEYWATRCPRLASSFSSELKTPSSAGKIQRPPQQALRLRLRSLVRQAQAIPRSLRLDD